MKKTLLATTAVGLFAAGSAFAAGPSVTVGGYADFQVGGSNQDNAFEGVSTKFSRDVHTRTDTEIYIKVKGKTDSGLAYGAHIELEANVNQDDNTGTDNNAEKTYIYVETGLGRLEAGANGDAAAALKVDASNFARATGGIAGDFHKYADLGSTGAGNDDYVITPDLPTAGFIGEVDAKTKYGRATANKITYYSPRIQGAQLGVSYTPDQGERGTSRSFSGENNQDNENVWNVGLNYQGQYDNLGIEAAVVGEWGNTEDNGAAASTLDDTQAYSVGLNLSYAGFTVGGSWAQIDEFQQTATANEEAEFWTLGAAYEFGPFAASVTYLDSEVENGTAAGMDNEFNNLSVGADYQLAPGLVPYVEVSFFDTDDNDSTSADNDGTVFLVGTELTF